MKVTLDTVSYSNPSDRKILISCLNGWFTNPRELQFTEPRMTYPFDFRKWCSQSYNEDNIQSYVVKMDKWIVAYLSVKVIFENRKAHFFHLFVDQKYRQQGLAKMLLDHAIQFVEKSKLNYITLHVASKNVRARSIYKQFGFIEVGETSRGSIKMKKDLG